MTKAKEIVDRLRLFYSYLLQTKLPLVKFQNEVKKLRSDGGGEYMGKQFKDVLIKYMLQ